MANTPQASLGYVGYVVFLGAGPNNSDIRVRATSCDMRLSQTIDKPSVVDSKYDKTVYQLGPREVGGSISFPAVHEDGSASIQGLWEKAIERDASGRLSQFHVEVKYANLPSTTVFRYQDCLVDTWEFSVTQGDVVNVNVGLVGVNRIAEEGRNVEYTFRNSRIVTWNDVKVGVINDEEFIPALGVTGSSIREFTATVNNNADRAYTLNSQLFPQDV